MSRRKTGERLSLAAVVHDAGTAGRELCRSYVAGEPERFHRLLTEQVRVRDLLEARNAGAARR